MDLLVGLVLVHLTSGNMDIGVDAVFPEDTRKKVEKLQKLTLDNGLKGAAAKIPHILAERALIIHGFGVLTMDETEQFHIAVRGRYKNKPQTVTADRIRSIIKDMEYVNTIFYDYLGNSGLFI